MRRALGSLVLMLAVSGCSAPDSGTLVGGDVMLPPLDPDGALREAVTVGDGPNGAHIIFLNFDGAAIKHSSNYQDDSATNTSWIAAVDHQYPAFDATPYGSLGRDGSIQQIMTYMQQYYAPFNAQIVSVRPASPLRYTMCMVGGTGQNISGAGGSAAGIAPLDCDNSHEADVVYAFSGVLTPNSTGSTTSSLKAIAVTCAQETAHSFGLGHTTNTKDIMYPQLSNSVTGFGGSSNVQNDGSGQCGNGKTQDSAGMLNDVIGPASAAPSVSPTVAFTAPTSGAIVPLAVDITITASETGGSISKVVVQNAGTTIATLTTAPYKTTWTAPKKGLYTLTATAYDASNNSASATVSFTADPAAGGTQTGCTTKSDCAADQDCINNECVDSSTGGDDDGTVGGGDDDGSGSDDGSGVGGGADDGNVGSTCQDGSECSTGLCAVLGNAHFCTESCDPGSNTCPSGSHCVAADGQHICQPNNLDSGSSSGGGCSAAPGAVPGSAAMLGACFLLCALALALRTRRS